MKFSTSAITAVCVLGAALDLASATKTEHEHAEKEKSSTSTHKGSKVHKAANLIGSGITHLAEFTEAASGNGGYYKRSPLSPVEEEIDAREFDEELDLVLRNLQDNLAARGEFDEELDARDFEEFWARFFDDELELDARDFGDEFEVEARDFDDLYDLDARDFEDGYEFDARNFEDVYELDARDFEDEFELDARDYEVYDLD